MKAETLAENIVKGSGGHGLKKSQLIKTGSLMVFILSGILIILR